MTPYTLLAPSIPATSTTPAIDSISIIGIDPVFTVEQQLRLGLDVTDARRARAQALANRAFAGQEILQASELQSHAKSIYDAQQAALATKDATISAKTSELATANQTISQQNTALTKLKEDLEDSEEETDLNSGLIGGLGMGGLALAGGIGAAAWNYKRDKPTRSNIKRKLSKAGKMVEALKTSKDKAERRKIGDVIEDFGQKQQAAAKSAMDIIDELDHEDQDRAMESLARHVKYTKTSLESMVNDKKKAIKDRRADRQSSTRARPASRS